MRASFNKNIFFSKSEHGETNIFYIFSSTAQQCLVHILHNSEHPASCFAVTESGQILVSDLLFEDLMSKLTVAKAGRESFYSQRKGFKIESRGQRYEIRDFIIKIGSVSLASNFRGILVEVSMDDVVLNVDSYSKNKV
jgi:mediator of RNA polymerase II transcription subunit 20